MATIEGKLIEGTTLEIDDTHFRNCAVSNCKLVYRGGVVSWEGTTWANCSITVADAANNTVEVLKGFGFEIKPPTGLPFSGTVH
jgi:hypothetical protein